MTELEIPLGLCQCGCGEATRISPYTDTPRGYVKGQPYKYARGHHGRSVPAYLVDEETGCWVWQRGKLDSGYGHLHADGKTRRAHRVFYEREVGPIPEGLELDHLCRNPSCVNPAHLEPVTHRENMLRAGVTGPRTRCVAGLHDMDEKNTFVHRSGIRECRACKAARSRSKYWEKKRLAQEALDEAA